MKGRLFSQPLLPVPASKPPQGAAPATVLPAAPGLGLTPGLGRGLLYTEGANYPIQRLRGKDRQEPLRRGDGGLKALSQNTQFGFYHILAYPRWFCPVVAGDSASWPRNSSWSKSHVGSSTTTRCPSPARVGGHRGRSWARMRQHQQPAGPATNPQCCLGAVSRGPHSCHHGQTTHPVYVAHCPHHTGIISSCNTCGPQLWDITSHPAGHCSSVAAVTPHSFTWWPQGSPSCRCLGWRCRHWALPASGLQSHPENGSSLSISSPVHPGHPKSWGSSGHPSVDTAGSALVHIMAGQPLADPHTITTHIPYNQGWGGHSSSSTPWLSSRLYLPAFQADKTTDTRSPPPPAPLSSALSPSLLLLLLQAAFCLETLGVAAWPCHRPTSSPARCHRVAPQIIQCLH